MCIQKGSTVPLIELMGRGLKEAITPFLASCFGILLSNLSFERISAAFKCKSSIAIYKAYVGAILESIEIPEDTRQLFALDRQFRWSIQITTSTPPNLPFADFLTSQLLRNRTDPALNNAINIVAENDLLIQAYEDDIIYLQCGVKREDKLYPICSAIIGELLKPTARTPIDIAQLGSYHHEDFAQLRSCSAALREILDMISPADIARRVNEYSMHGRNWVEKFVLGETMSALWRMITVLDGEDELRKWCLAVRTLRCKVTRNDLLKSSTNASTTTQYTLLSILYFCTLYGSPTSVLVQVRNNRARLEEVINSERLALGDGIQQVLPLVCKSPPTTYLLQDVAELFLRGASECDDLEWFINHCPSVESPFASLPPIWCIRTLRVYMRSPNAKKFESVIEETLRKEETESPHYEAPSVHITKEHAKLLEAIEGHALEPNMDRDLSLHDMVFYVLLKEHESQSYGRLIRTY